MNSSQAFQAPIVFEMDGERLQINVMQIDDWIAWGAELDAKRVAELTKGMTEEKRFQYLAVYYVPPLPLETVHSLVNTPPGIKRVIKTCVGRAKVIARINPERQRLIEDAEAQAKIQTDDLVQKRGTIEGEFERDVRHADTLPESDQQSAKDAAFAKRKSALASLVEEQESVRASINEMDDPWDSLDKPEKVSETTQAKMQLVHPGDQYTLAIRLADIDDQKIKMQRIAEQKAAAAEEAARLRAANSEVGEGDTFGETKKGDESPLL